MTRRRAKIENPSSTRVWTLVLVLLVMVVAFVMRAVVVYQFYPLEHQQLIAQNSEDYKLDPYLVSAVICTESRFKETAVSPKGAVGLMQIMPDTGAWIAEKLKMESYTEEKLVEPETNIELGCWYLRYLTDRFEGDYEKVLAAYNAGPNKVAEWAGEGSLEEIPYPETENYIKSVKRNHYIYKGLYNDF